ncbi:glutamine--fructose-6-phosphate transaminase (isomerizing), partial [bacterium]|nr:glutamine--fructose-6-phosphate transaminase (isomerizing) [bacterium]
MCGIVGYVGKKQALPILVKGLARLEYRGYDSSGVAILENNKIERVRSIGKIENLNSKLKEFNLKGNIGIAHTRWATHGDVTEKNAHPHFGTSNKLVIVHNGIIENYRELKEKFLKDIKLKSETDTEILACLIDEFYKGNLRDAILKALSYVRGTYGLVVMHEDYPNTLIAARFGSPLVIGISEDEYYIASDTSPMLAYTKKVIFLEDRELVEIKLGEELKIFDLKDKKIFKNIEEISWDESQAQKQGYDHFMLKEIFDQPRVFEDAIRGRFNLEEGSSNLGGLNMTISEMNSINKIILLACGTASYAAMVGKYAFERLSGIPCEVDVASEFRYRDPIIDENTLVFALSQSGETADTIAAIKEVKRKGAKVRGIVNVIGSTIARETGAGSYIHAGPELAVASTKAYTNMIAVLILYAIQFGRNKRLTIATGKKLINALLEIPEKMNKILSESEKIKNIAEKYKNYKDFFYLGRGVNFPVALEGSLKLKEISYIHSEAYPGGEMKHGPIALLSENFPVFGIVTKNQLYEKMLNNLEEVKARKSPI